MDSLIIYFLPTIIALGIVTSYEDIKEGKIRNRYILAAFGIGLLTYLILISSGMTDWNHLLINLVFCIFALIVGFLIWHLDWWRAGDAKLFSIFAFLLPATAYARTTTPAPFLEIIINSVVPVSLYIAARLLIKSNSQTKLKALKDTFEPKSLGIIIISLFSASWLVLLLTQYLKIVQTFLLNFILIVIIIQIINRVFKENTFPILALIAILRVFLSKEYILTKSFMTGFLTTIILYICLIGFLRRLSEYDSYKVSIHNLKVGMVPAEGIFKNGLKGRFDENQKDKYLMTKTKPLRRKDIATIIRLHQRGLLHFNTLRIRSSLKFAPILFTGIIITMVCNGSMILFLINLLGA
jgi:Flp pilus assembly protein protease CpaA